MELLSSINNSGIGAQYAVSAERDVNGNEITSTYLTAVPEGYATESFVTSQGYVTGSYLTADALDNVSGTWNTVMNKLDSTAFSTVSGSFLTSHQSLPNSANWNSTYNTVTGNSGKWNDTYGTVHDNSASWTGGGASVTSPRGTININGDEIEGTNSAVLTGTAGGYETYLLANDNYIQPNPTVLTNNSISVFEFQTGGTLVIPIVGGDPSLYITVTGETIGGGTATASGQASGTNPVYIPLGEMKGPFTAQATYWVNLSTITLTASAAPTTGITGVGELAWNSALNSVRNTSATWNSTYNTVATNSASWGAGSTYTGDAQGALDEVYSNSGDWNTVTDKLDSTAFSTVSGSFITAHQALPNSANWDSTYTTVSTNSASWENVITSTATGNTGGTGISAINSTPLLATAVYNKGKMFVGSSDPGIYLTGTHGTAYYKANELIINRTGYGEQIKFNLGSAGSQVIGSAAGTRGAFIDMSNDSHEAFLGARTDEDAKLELDGEVITPTKITNYDSVYDTVYTNSGSWAGGFVPEGVLVESGLEYNAVNEISGYNGSAIAQYGAEKQWLQHDDTLVHAANSAQYALGVNLSAVAQLLGVDETVLYSGTSNTTSIEFTETPYNFKKLRFIPGWNTTTNCESNYVEVELGDASNLSLNFQFPRTDIWNTFEGLYSISNTGMTITQAQYVWGAWGATTSTTNTASKEVRIKKVIGIGRKEV